eukprot:Plantae.Rhodophyta-Purpureofilum_apyrenoidigerum.ctg9180.p1 GENE.Plantae.Rhodophyta-Purpureofilum_apyrenoidigerum.ctg9180~~Plantae.Rhodophyta-Purpureofilum_apyrenoidigerum.ctg9180.p1  ORF type:complete len:671 (+),score=82.18 Plantae.Rhodophyta-Purpureofilum_apyrenoidigerum.ctg9180:33-2015(+)
MARDVSAAMRRRKGGSDKLSTAPRVAEAAAKQNSTHTGQGDGRSAREPSHLRKTTYQLFSRYRKLRDWAPNPVTALTVLLFARLYSAITTGIADCDETFNYWEPLHYLSFGYGFQTWEYSPEFALRSYAYLSPFSAVANTALRFSNMNDVNGKFFAFYGVRVIQAFASAIADAYLYDSTVWRFGKRTAGLLLVFLTVCPGLFRASVELLPSSFAMIAMSVAVASWMVGDFAISVSAVAVAAVLGWPFAAVLGIPMAFHIVYRRGFKFFAGASIVPGVLLLATSFAYDTFYYGSPTLSPLNLLRYNVFPEKGSGSNIFGVEDWTYYAFNLFLNLNIVALLVMLQPALWVLDSSVVTVWKKRSEAVARAIFLSPSWIWLFVFFNQPHKEERFMSPIYPQLCLIASVTLTDILTLLFGETSEGSLRLDHSEGATDDNKATLNGDSRKGIIFTLMRTFFTLLILSICALLSASRTAAILRNYSAPVEIFKTLSRVEFQRGIGPRNAPSVFYARDAEINICMGKEWHRFPSNFFLPDQRYRLRFVKSNFDGMLPKFFNESRYGSRAKTTGFNSFNREDPGQYISDPAQRCHYYVDMGATGETGENPIPEDSRAVLFREPFVDKERSPLLVRTFYVPWISDEKIITSFYVVTRNLDIMPLVYHSMQ